MSNRIFNFSAGPCTLPLPALEKAQAEFVNYQGAGVSLLEMSHRGKHYDSVHYEAMAGIREVLAVPDSHDILFIQGGATLQFAMVPLNLIADGKPAEFLNTGTWVKKAIADAEKLGPIRILWTGEADNFTRMPAGGEYQVGVDAAYVHICGNETIGGIEYHKYPDTGTVPLVADMSSHIMSRPIEWGKLDLAFAGAQKNLGPAGMALVVIDKALVEKCRDNLPAYLSYKTHAAKDSLYNTPPVFAIYMMKLTVDWVKEQGGLAEMEKRALVRSGALYDTIDRSDGWYRCPVDTASRSRMNVCFRLPTEELEAKFIAEALEANFSGLKGHRSVGGCRASMYNAMPIEGAEELAAFMLKFKQKNA
ncbi:MAG: 3-phosphoserine/phosphohydroxythreonine transaminase [Deltaproteobacteria bacterium]|jgi:phosphoserine aminotransferase|nr:3-phosphoserine/phosphohydroxythreonine transaminase [Deltaproteobacteria bacterium]